LQVSYRNSQQSNDLERFEPGSTIDITKGAWNRKPVDEQNGHSDFVPLHVLDTVGMYLRMVDMISGTIVYDPRETLIIDTKIGLILTLITNLPKGVTTYYGQGTPYLPKRDLRVLVEELSDNLIMSLMSNPTLLISG